MVYTVGGVQYTRRKKIPITGAGSGAQTDFQIKLTALWEKSMQADYDDARFTKADMQTLIDAWLESKTDSTTADIWAEFPATPANGVEKTEAYMYYGNAAVGSDWDIGATFLFGDDFPGTSIDTGKWGGDTGDASVSGGICTFDRNASWGGIDSLSSYTPDMALRCRSKTNGTDAGGGPAIGFQKTPCCAGRSNVYNTGLMTNDDSGVSQSTTGLWSHSTWYIHDLLQISGTSVELLCDGVSKVTHTTRVGTTAQPVRIASYQSSIEVDWVLVRKYVLNPPTAAFGTEEHQRRTPMMM